MAQRAKKTNLLLGSVSKVDRISSLPIPLLHHILSFLPVNDMVKTCIFSKNWRNIWFSAPSLHINNLIFKQYKYRNKISISFEQFVDFLLLTRGGSNIHKFSLCIEPEYNESESEPEAETQAEVDLNPSKVNAWILYALRHNVEVIDLQSYMSVTPLLFSCESLRELKLSLPRYFQHFPPATSLQQWANLPSSVNLPSLKILQLNGVAIQAGQLDDAVFLAMPSLETLHLEHCNFSPKKLSIVSTYKLTTFIMVGPFLAHFDLSLSAPNLKYLKLDPLYHFCTDLKTMRFKNNCIQLINANIAVGVSCSESVIELFAVLQNASSLKLSSTFLKSFTSLMQNDLCIVDCITTPFHNLTHMELGTVLSDEEALAINNVLYHSPCIEVLKIVMCTYAITKGKSFEEEEVWSEFKLCRLKLVQINDFRPTVNQIRFVKFLLESALVMDDMIVTTARSGNKQELRIVGKELLLYPRASPTLVMQFG